ncbi:hypothetical protein GGTG_04375 [Gaeumannomyces tritici R3-111a-1]|uniref:Uncharacterized protein n=1 Tax=Gaeumannomyces tritici (strain R3-111a-1) TaxID=644352 RepID=J3NSX6_GAET3|nr:hypothetical protein GGTG_04375 [Gaeumannomyces tritici R3-111a-1]EJT79289.1 hypothetical protein GGTG_04375 [Gaeumannomyces tritici R3-111a-1]
MVSRPPHFRLATTPNRNSFRACSPELYCPGRWRRRQKNSAQNPADTHTHTPWALRWGTDQHCV